MVRFRFYKGFTFETEYGGCIFFSNCDQERDCLRFVLSVMQLGMLDKQWDGKCRRSALLYYNMNDDDDIDD